MKIYCVSNIPVKPYVIESNVDGISLEVPAYSLFGMGKVGNPDTASRIKKELKVIGDAGKSATLAIPFGNECGSYIWQNHPYLDMVFRSHGHSSTPGKPIDIKVPVPYDAGYIAKVKETITWLSNELKKDAVAYSVLESVKITASNRTTPEMCAPDMDWTGTNDAATAYSQAAAKWIGMKYTPEKFYNANLGFINLFSECFSGKNLLQSYIPLLNGVPCIDGLGKECKPKERPITTEYILDYGIGGIPNFQRMYTAYVGNPVQDKYVQINREKFGMRTSNLSEAIFSALLNNARTQGIEYCEVFDLDVLYYKTIFT